MNLNEAKKILSKVGYKLVARPRMDESIFMIMIDAMAHRIMDKLTIDIEQSEESFGEDSNTEGMVSYAIVAADDIELLKDLTTALNQYKEHDRAKYGFDPADAEFDRDYIDIPFNSIVDRDGGIANVREVIRFTIIYNYKMFMKYDEATMKAQADAK